MGTNTVASMVVFERGAPKKSDYRRFKVFGDADDGNGGAGTTAPRENSPPHPKQA